MSAFGWLKELISPVATLIDEVHTSDEERAVQENKKIELQRQLFALETAVQGKMLEYETAALEARTKLAEVESKSEHWLVWARRPIMEFASFTILTLMLTPYIPWNETMAWICGAILGINNALRGVSHVTANMMQKP